MAFFRSFQESLSSVSVSSILDSVSSTVSSTVDGVRTAVSDVTYTVSDQLTEQVNTIINKKQGEEEDKAKKDEASSENDSESRMGAGARINSKRHAYADENEEQKEKEKQEQERRNEEEQWEWCYAPSKGWYRKRRDPNQKHTSEETQENKDERTGGSEQLSSSNGNMNFKEVTAVRMENNEGGQEDTISKTSAETAYCEDTGKEQCPVTNNNQTNGHVQEAHGQDGHTQDGDGQDGHDLNTDGQDTNKAQSDDRRNSTSTKPNQLTGGGAAGGGAVESYSVDGDSEEGSSRSRGSSVLKDQQHEDEATGSEGHIEVTEVSGDRKDTEHSNTKDRFRRCTLL